MEAASVAGIVVTRAVVLAFVTKNAHGAVLARRVWSKRLDNWAFL